jgi:type 1 fimbriae regulatory protein FimB
MLPASETGFVNKLRVRRIIISVWLTERARMKPTGKTFFIREQRKPLHRSTVNLALRKYSAAASLPLRAHPLMLRHAAASQLADQGADTRLIQDVLGHRNIQHTVRYPATNPPDSKALAVRIPADHGL